MSNAYAELPAKIRGSNPSRRFLVLAEPRTSLIAQSLGSDILLIDSEALSAVVGFYHADAAANRLLEAMTEPVYLSLKPEKRAKAANQLLLMLDNFTSKGDEALALLRPLEKKSRSRFQCKD